MKRFSEWVRREKHGPAAIVLVAALLLVAGLWIMSQSERSYRTDQVRGAQVQADILAASVIAPLDFGDRLAAQEAVDALRVNPQLQVAGIYDAKGALFAGYRRDGQPLPSVAGEIGRGERDTAQAVMPAMRDGQRIGTVYLRNAIEPLSRRLSRYAMIALLLFMTTLVLAVVAVAHAALSRANRELEDHARSLAEANSELQVQMDERTRAEEQLRQSQKMQALGQLTGGIAHDFNNMLTVIQGSADILRRATLADDKRLHFASAIAETASRATALTSQLLAFARRQPLSPVPLNLNDRVRGMVPLLDPLLGATIAIRLELADGLHAVEADPAQLEAAILNVVANARDAMPDGGEVTIKTRNVSAEDSGGLGNAVMLSIRDNGAGFHPAIKDRAFEPFFTTKSVGKGTGLGLSQVYGFVTQSGGEVNIESVPGKGAEVILTLPASSRQVVADLGVPKTSAARVAGRILLVEDNPQVGAFAETLLSELGHQVVRANNGIEALKLTDAGASYDLVFSDVVMPGMGGLELAGEIRQRRPDVPIILTTGYSDRIASAGSQGHVIIPKPYRLETVADALERALAGA
jgi:signal transduction histidine kinase